MNSIKAMKKVPRRLGRKKIQINVSIYEGYIWPVCEFRVVATDMFQSE